MSDAIRLGLPPDARLVPADDGTVTLEAGESRMVLRPRSDGFRDAIEALRIGGATPSALAAHVGAAGAGAGPSLDRLVAELGDGGFLTRTAYDGAQALATLVPLNARFAWRAPQIDAQTRYRLSRFAYVRRDRDRTLLETPLVPAYLELLHPLAGALVTALDRPRRVVELTAAGVALSVEGIDAMMQLLAAADAVFAVDDDGRTEEDARVPAFWEFHDLLFHAKTRQGRRRPYPAKGERFPEAEKTELPEPPLSPRAVRLAAPDLEVLRRKDRTLTDVLESRESIRTQGATPLTLETLGEFLYRIRHERQREVMGFPFASAPYASGGGMLEQSIFVLVNAVDGLDAGLYRYIVRDHALDPLETDTAERERLGFEFAKGYGSQELPQVAFPIAVRFEAIAGQYASISYALMLKNLGGLMQTMYLVATAMDLAPCALGIGDSDLFARVSGLDYYAEGTIGEFVLGSK